MARFVRDSLLAAGGDEGTVLPFPTSTEALGDAVGLVRQGGFEWRATLRGSGAQGEDVWLVGALGPGGRLTSEAAEVLAEGCVKRLDAALQSTEGAFEGGVRSLHLAQ